MINNEHGTIAFEGLKSIEEHHKNVKVLNSVFMPNHIHLLLSLDNCDIEEIKYNKFGEPLQNSVSTIIGSYKSAASKAIHLAESKALYTKTMDCSNISSDTACEPNPKS